MFQTMNEKIFNTNRKSISELAKEWDELAEKRHQQIESGIDWSFDHILAPLAFELLKECDDSSLLDIGCGTGELTSKFKKFSNIISAIDISERSIEIAKGIPGNSHTDFYCGSLEKLSNELATQDFKTAIAAMTLMNTPSIKSFADSLSKILKTGSKFVATITHPCFWPRYWNYEDESWYSYEKEIFIEAPFEISAEKTELRTTHIHRPLEMYISVFKEAGFVLRSLKEPVSSDGNKLEYPKFIGLLWEKRHD